MSEETTNTEIKSRKPIRDAINQHCNYPMLLLAITVIVGLRGILQSIISLPYALVNGPQGIIQWLLSIILAAAPALLFLLLWRDRFHKINNVKKWFGATLLLLVAVSLWKNYRFITMFVYQIGSIDNIYELLAMSSFLKVLDIVLLSVVYLILGISLLGNKKVSKAYYVFLVAIIFASLFLGILTQMGGIGSLLNSFWTVLGYLALWYVPKALEDTHSVDITPGKGKALLAIVGITLFVMVAAVMAVGSSGGGTSSITCNSCHKTFSSGDSNYSSIYRSGLCDDCYNNLKTFEWVLK